MAEMHAVVHAAHERRAQTLGCEAFEPDHEVLQQCIITESSK